MQLAMIAEKIIALDKVENAYFDRAMYFGDGVYEVLRSYNGKLFALDDHLQRLQRSLKEIEITGVDINDIRSRIEKAFNAAQIPDAVIYFHITRGSELRDHKCSENLQPNFFLTVTKAHDDSEKKNTGIAVSTYPDLRWKRCDIKSLNLLPNVLAKKDAAKKGCDEAILVNDQGLITEGASSAFFAILDSKLYTSPLTANVLPSITRKYIIQTAEKIGLGIVEKQLTPDQTANADELFIASSGKDITGVVKFDDKLIGNGKPGKFTKLLTEEFVQFTK